MSYFDSVFNKLFPVEERGKQVTVKEVIKRSTKDLEAYHLWKLSYSREKLIADIAAAFLQKKHEKSELIIHHYKSIYANGFAIHYHPGIGKKDFIHLFDYFKDKVLGLGYRTAGSDRQYSTREKYVEITEKHYLKPPFDFTNNVTDQRFGNVSIEHVVADNQPHFLKVMVSIYSDRLYKDPLSYHDFIQQLFSLER